MGEEKKLKGRMVQHVERCKECGYCIRNCPAGALSLNFLCSCGKKEKNYVTLPEDFGSEEYAIGFRPGDVALAKEVQRILDEMCADGTADTISQKWFSTNLIVNDRDYPRDEEVSADDTSLEDLKSRGKFILGLDDSFTIQTTSTSAEEYLPVGTVGAKIDVQSITGLMMRPTVSIQDQSGTEMPVVYDEEKGMFVEQTEATAISDAEKTAVMGALEAYSGYMINASGARQNVAKYFDSNSDAYQNIMKIGAELWMNTDRGHKFLDETITDYVKYTDELFSCKASLTMQVTLKDGSLSSYDVEESMFFRLKNGNWVCYGMTNKDVTKPVGKVRITFISDLTDGITLSSQFYETDAATLMTPVITAPEGKIFSGWVKETTVNGRTELTVVFTPDENGQVTVPAGTTLEPMTLYALFENAE